MDAALVLLATDAVAREASLPSVVGVAAHLALLLIPAARRDLLLLAAVASDGLDLATVTARAEVAESAAAVLATWEFAIADLVADRRERRVVGRGRRALDSERRGV
jgi:hypothetical protein